jgi:phenylalanyl-tRNA synthetase beta chain
MKVLLSWLKEYIDINLLPTQIAKLLTAAGLEVDAIESIDPGFSNIVVGKVLSAIQHPNADKLRVATVSDGSQTYQVVCGASNCREGIKTAFAPIKAVLTDSKGKPFSIQQVKIRGVESFGMLCSGAELGISSDSEGIVEFADHVKEGSSVAEMYADTLFDISLTPNLGHCQSILGIARELAAVTNLPLRYPAIVLQEDEWEEISKQVKVTIKDEIKCPRYACRLVRNVTIGPSPDWLKRKLEKSGLRSVNNVVDVTNYVLLELGHPLHAFDFDLIAGREIVVKDAEEGEGFMTLDNKKRILSKDDLLICDQNKGVALAGIMGGLISEVSDQTKNVLIESAYFQPTSIRRTSKRLGLQTDSSKRFERGADPNGLLAALDRAAMLIQQLSGGKIAKGTIDIKKQEFEKLQLKCRLKRVNQLLGIHLGTNEVESIFKKLGFEAIWDGHAAFEVRVPTYRVDIKNEIDLIEEVARIYGYDNIPRGRVPFFGSQQEHAPMFIFESEVRSHLLAEGLQEFLTCDLIGPALMNIVQDDTMPQETIVKVLNPSSVEQSILRTSLLPGLLQVVKYNIDYQNHAVQGFEIGRIHFKEGDQYKEQSMAAIILSGKQRPQHWDIKPGEVDFYDLKGIIENTFEELGLEGLEFKPSTFKIFHTGRQASLYLGEMAVGFMGEVHPAIQRRLDVPQRILFAEFNLHDLLPKRKIERTMKQIPVFPASARDWTVTLPEEIAIEKVFNILQSIHSPHLENISVIDMFRAEKLGKGKKNVTLHFIYRDKNKTLEMEEVEKEHSYLIEQALQKVALLESV